MSARRWIVAAMALVLVAALVATAGALWMQRQLSTPFQGWTGSHVDVGIEPGMTATAVAARLQERGVVANSRLLVGWLWWTGTTGSLQAGSYRFAEARDVRAVARVIVDGRVRLQPVTVPEGSTRWDVAHALERAGFSDYETALRETSRAELIRDLDPEAESLEGYLYPETYMAAAGDGAEQLVGAMVQRFRLLWDAERQGRARQLGMSVRQVVTLASIIEAETPAAYERPLVSAVFHNRLRLGMLLQTDPTVLYAKRLAGRDERVIRRSDLNRDSPYNTYRVAGLPAGPIGNPRAASIDAALLPAAVDLLYFVSRNDGTHAFSRTLAEHQRWVNLYQR